MYAIEYILRYIGKISWHFYLIVQNLMKKNLFLLFSIYFFVLQPLIIGGLRWQNNFFLLGGINLLAIILISLFTRSTEGENKEIHEHEKKPEVIHETKGSFHEHFRAVVKARKKKSELVFPFVIWLIITVALFLVFQYDITTAILLFGSILSGFIVFILLTSIYKHRVSRRFRALIGTWIYIILLLCSIALIAYDYYQVRQNFNASIEDYFAQNVLGQERIPTNGYVFTGEGTVLGSGIWNTDITQTTSTDVFTWSTPIQETTETGTTTLATNPTTPPTSLGNQKLMDAVIYLLKKYDIPLNTKQDVSFTYVTFKNPYYNEWRTAYANKLIGKNTNPSKYIICESYIVMKGLLEKWNVPYTSRTVLNNFRAEAVKRDALNGCVQGKIVTDKTL